MSRGAVPLIGILLAIVIGSVCSIVFEVVSNTGLTAAINERVVLPCNPHVPGPVRWCFHRTTESGCDEIAINGGVVDDHGEHYELQDNNYLVVKSFDSDLSGSYVCIEENGYGYIHRVNLTVTADAYRPGAVIASTNPTLTDNSTELLNSALHQDEHDEQDSTLVSIFVVVGGVVSGVLILLIVFAVFNLKYGIRRKKREPPAEARALVPKADVLEDIKRICNDVDRDQHSYRNTRDSWQSSLCQPGNMTECAKWAASYVKGLDRKPDAVIGIHGSSNTGSLLALRVAELLELQLILAYISDPQKDANDNRAARLELVPERDNYIRKVIIVDTEMITGRSMKATVDEVKINNREIIECIVVNDCRTCALRLVDAPAVHSLSHHGV